MARSAPENGTHSLLVAAGKSAATAVASALSCVRDRLLTWFFLGAVGGVVPLAAEWVVRSATDKPTSASAIIGRGELLLVSVVIGSSAVGALVTSAAERHTRIIGWGLGFPSLLLIGVYYGGVAASAESTNPGFVAIRSAVIFGIVVIIGALCVALAKDTT
jgi:hypothetical protein